MRPSLQRARFTSDGHLIRQGIAVNYPAVADCAAKSVLGDVDVRVAGRGRAKGSPECTETIAGPRLVGYSGRYRAGLHRRATQHALAR